MTKYHPEQIEPRWQKAWLQQKPYQAWENSGKPKYYQLETFPYPSGAGIHIGHPKGYTAEDVHARYQRMRGFEVLYTMGWDAFGLPTENYAIKVGKSPKDVAHENVTNFKRQVQMFGFSYDWDREIDTSHPNYYRWTQWLFLQLFKKGLAYKAKANVNWCPKDQTVLANEQVIDGRCERDGELVIQKQMEQWFFKITDYADRLLEDLPGLDWPEASKKRQEDWIGRSEGALITFSLAGVPGQEDGKHVVEVFTTRPDTIFGATFVVVSPELAQKWIDVGWQTSDEVKAYIKESFSKRELERLEQKEKTGVDAGIKAINPATGQEIPVWIADYVIGSYGTGAIMAVPAHDERDREFIRKYPQLQLKCVVIPRELVYLDDNGNRVNLEYPKDRDLIIKKMEEVDGGICFSGEGVIVQSGKFSEMDSKKARWEITTFVKGEKKTQYKIRDWSVSRQRYWGVPIPIIYCEKCGTVPVPEKELPVTLPDLENYRPQGMPPLASSPEFLKVQCPTCGGDAQRDPETLDTFVDSSWYYLRYADPHNDQQFAAPEKLKHWLPVDLYVIGAEHTTLHMLYSRFITKFLHDAGFLDFQEPFLKLHHVGLILGTDGQKMSKSKGNVVNPDEAVSQYGADTVRLYLMFMGPFDQAQPWDTKGILGGYRFLNRVWNYTLSKNVTDSAESPEAVKAINHAIKKVGHDIEGFRFNTAISELMMTLNTLEAGQISKPWLEKYLLVLAPFAPHITEELWHQLGHDDSIHQQPWPKCDPSLLIEEVRPNVTQVDGRVRDSSLVKTTATEEELKQSALTNPKVIRFIEGKEITKVIVKDLGGTTVTSIVTGIKIEEKNKLN